MAENLFYPYNVRKVSHIKISAFEYSLPKVEESFSGFQKSSEPLANIYLYVPANITENVGAQWSAESVTETIQTIATSDKEGFDFGSDVLKGLGRDFIKIADKFSAGGVSNAQKTAAALGGYLLRPNDVLVLDSLNRFNISLTWILNPINETESEHIIKIIKNFKRWSQPTLVESGAKQLLKYPPIFDLYINSNINQTSVSKKNQNRDIFYYQNLVLENFNASYGGGSEEALFYNNGTPIMTTLTLNFKSLKHGWNVEEK